eukprot:GSA120T00008410001.1
MFLNSHPRTFVFLSDFLISCAVFYCIYRRHPRLSPPGLRATPPTLRVEQGGSSACRVRDPRRLAYGYHGELRLKSATQIFGKIPFGEGGFFLSI